VKHIPQEWFTLRTEAIPLFQQLHIFQAALEELDMENYWTEQCDGNSFCEHHDEAEEREDPASDSRPRQRQKYHSLSELKTSESESSWQQTVHDRESWLLVVAPHGGTIEKYTERIAKQIAGPTHSLFMFEGRRSPGRELRVSSHLFRDPALAKLQKKAKVTLSIHGKGDPGIQIFLGGSNEILREDLRTALISRDFNVLDGTGPIAGLHKNNFVNRTSDQGVQLELCRGLRDKLVETPELERAFIEAIHEALATFAHWRRLDRLLETNGATPFQQRNQSEQAMIRESSSNAVSRKLDPPANVGLPFVAYGMFKPGELGFLRIKPYVHSVRFATVEHCLMVRDGLPVIDCASLGSTSAAIIEFLPEQGLLAYQAIADLEPKQQYRWQEIDQEGTLGNILVGNKPRRGSVTWNYHDGDWQGADDPLFGSALDVIEETLNANIEFEWDLKPMMRLQMAYLLLWSAIERYATIRYCLSDNPTKKVNAIGAEPAFVQALKDIVTRTGSVYSAEDPSDKVNLNPLKPMTAIKYYYQVRSNAIHVGKGVANDHHIIAASLSELLPIFRRLLASAFLESKWAD
jgi:phage replication-related protein YjqB (UPF0714/DUF867 family)